MQQRTDARKATMTESVQRPIGPRIYNLFPLLVGNTADWRRELPRIAAMAFDWVFVNPFHASGGSGSLYSIADTDRLDERFRAGDAGGDDAEIARFVAEARDHGLGVMIDLVINHAAIDGRLAREHPDWFVRDRSGGIAHPYAVDPDDPAKRVVWGDLGELDWHGEAARGALLEHWDRYIARMQGLGVAGFRCDAAYKVPAEVWRALIGAAKGRAPALFAAETLGCTFDETRTTAAGGFDYLFNSFAWWDLDKPWALESYEALRLAAPSIAFPENHDMPRLAGAIEGGPSVVAAQLKARYLHAALFSAGVLMPIGYEWGYRRSLHVVGTSPADRETTGIDISDFIGAVNRLRAGLPAANVEGAQWRLTAPSSSIFGAVRFDAGHPQAADHAVLLVANRSGAPLRVSLSSLLARTGGTFRPFADVTPGAQPSSASGSIVLGAHEVRVLSAMRLMVAKPRGGRVAPPTGEGRVVIEGVWPELDAGATPVKRLVGETVEVWADIFSDGHDKIAAELIYRPAGETEWRRTPMRFVDNDRWSGSFLIDRIGRWQFSIEGWRDLWDSWLIEIDKKRAAGVPVALETIEGLHLAEAAAARAAGTPDEAALQSIVAAARAAPEGSEAQLAVLLDPHNAELLDHYADRKNLTRYPRTLEVIADRLAARFSAWYELFPRSQSGDPTRHGTFDDVIARLPYVQGLGFDVLYFTPIHPIGRTNRKGKNNSLKAAPGDVGSVYAIGSDEGGHKALHPELGTFEDFARLVKAAHAHGLEIALDFAIQCSPDHPWIKEHPEWFDWRPDGTIKFAENPPKKYEDIVNVHFYRDALPSIWLELRDTILFWAEKGVRIFRVDNPHTKAIPFWEWMIREVNKRYPDVLFLSEAFTRPKMMRKLAKVGFQQSYTYFTWRNTKHEIIEYMNELKAEMGEYYRPNFFANTPDINPYFLQTSGRAGFIIRGTLAALLSSNWGIYNGFELAEGRPLPGKEEYIDSEKYELKAWDYDRPGNIRAHIKALNHIRRENPAFQDFRNVTFLNAWNDSILAFYKMTAQRDNLVMVLVSLDPRERQECTYEVPLWEFGLPDHGSVEVEDLLGGHRFRLTGKTHRIALDPIDRSVAIWRLVPPRMAA